MKFRKFLASLVMAAGLVACSGPDNPPTFKVVAIDTPIVGSATSPRLSSGPGGHLVMSWLQQDDDAVSLNYSRFTNGHWAESNLVARSEDMLVNWADRPSVVPLGGDRLAAHWMLMSGAYSEAYDVAFSESRDDGRTWSMPITPHTDGTDTEHGFASIYVNNDEAGLIWLDGRKMVNEPTDDPVASGMTLRSGDQLIDELVCDCCQTDVALTSSGPVAVYRNRSIDEMRDIYITRMIDGRWQPGTPVAIDGWKIQGCPVNGPSIDADGDTVAVAWFTAATEPLVNVAISRNSGVSFSAPIEIVRGNTLGRVAVALLDDEAVAVSWLESTDPALASVKVRRVNADGSPGPIRLIANTAGGLSVPQMQRQGHDLVFAWSGSGADGDRVESARVAINSL